MTMLMKITDDDDFRETFVNGQCNFRAFLASSSEAVDSAARGGALLLDHDLRRLHQAPQHAFGVLNRLCECHHLPD